MYIFIYMYICIYTYIVTVKQQTILQQNIHTQLFLSHRIWSLKKNDQEGDTFIPRSKSLNLSFVWCLCNACPKRTLRQCSSSTSCSNQSHCSRFMTRCRTTLSDKRRHALTEIVLVSVKACSTRIPPVTDKTEGRWDAACADLWDRRGKQRFTFHKTKAQLGSSIALLNDFAASSFCLIWTFFPPAVENPPIYFNASYRSSARLSKVSVRTYHDSYNHVLSVPLCTTYSIRSV